MEARNWEMQRILDELREEYQQLEKDTLEVNKREAEARDKAMK